jgi:iron complex transport system permease protein
MQNNLKNPLASPDTLGVSAGAAFGANLAIIVLGAGTIMYTAGDAVAINNPYLVTVCAFICAMAATLVILALGKIRGFSPEAIVLAGVALGSLFMAGTTLIQYFAPDVKIAAAIFWTFGDLGRVSWNETFIIIAVVVLAAIYFIWKRWDYNAMDNGEETAKSLGVRTERIRLLGMLISSLITAITVSFVGIIGFIGLIGPHIMRRIIGTDHRFLIPASMLAGAVLLLISDTLARTMIRPVVLPVGALTSILGAPLFIYLLMKGMKERGRA